MSKKLTNELRDNLSKQQANLKFDKKIDAEILKLNKQIEKDFYKEHKFPKVDQTLVDEGFVLLSSNVYVNIEKEDYNIIRSIENRKFFCSGSNAISINLEVSYPKRPHRELYINISPKASEILKKIISIYNQKSKFRIELKQVLYSINTFKQAREVLPEMKNSFTEDTVNLLPIPVSQINHVREMLRA